MRRNMALVRQMLLEEAGLIHTVDFSTFGGSDYRRTRLTPSGHEFLDASRDEGRWQRALNIMKEKTGVIAFDVLTELLVQLMQIAYSARSYLLLWGCYYPQKA